MTSLQTYNTDKSYQWNYDRVPEPVKVDIPAIEGDWTFCGRPVSSPLGIPAGPLLNGKWVLYYASLGFDVLTYKTVRSVQRACYPLPNLQPVQCEQLTGQEIELCTAPKMLGSWAVAFGMPSRDPAVWRDDVAKTRAALANDKILSVSVVGSIQDGWTLDQLADDYAQCAYWAKESGADCVEANFSCPNVSTRDGQLYQNPTESGQVASKIRDRIGQTPFIIKIGHVPQEDNARDLLDQVAPYVDAIALTNSVAATVRAADGKLLFDGERRGICGDATRTASREQTRLFARLIDEQDLSTRLIGVGGASTAQHVRDYLAAGAEATHIATAAMVNPAIGIKIRSAWRS